MFSFYTSCAKGSEHVLEKELLAMGAENIRTTFGGVYCTHTRENFYYDINLKTRVGFRVFKPMETFSASSPEELYANGKKIRWDRLFHKTQTFSITAHVKSSNITNSQYAGLKLKDAVADWFRDRFGERPNVDAKNPDMPFHLLIDKNEATLSLDTTGRSLHRRGYRVEKTAAPLMETLAATMIQLSGWDGKTPFYDLMCGSGTIGIEAALFANHTVPGLLNDEFAFQKWSDYSENNFRDIQDECEEYEEIENLTTIYVNDIDQKAVDIAKKNAKRAGVRSQCKYNSINALDFRPVSDSGIIMINPPYGERIGERRDLAIFLGRLEQVVKQHFTGHRICILAPMELLKDNFRMKPTKTYTLYNAKIECQFAIYDIYPAI
jgi:putative N6-adenine-specific DNA methylase